MRKWMVKFSLSGSLLVCGLLMFSVFASCGDAKSNAAKEVVNQECSDTADGDQLQVAVTTLRSELPIANEEGEFQKVSQKDDVVVIDYVMAEERFMSYYSMSEEERNEEKLNFRELLDVTPFESLLYQCYEKKVGIRLNVIGVTSREQFAVYFSVDEL